MHYIEILIQNLNFNNFLIFSNLNNNKTKLHVTIYRSLDLHKSYESKLVRVSN